jgi:hypothetical protein
MPRLNASWSRHPYASIELAWGCPLNGRFAASRRTEDANDDHVVLAAYLD